METEKFSVEDGIIFEADSAMQLKAVNDENAGDDIAWISGWFATKDHGLIIQKFVVLSTGRPCYRLAAKAVDYWGLQVLGTTAAANEMSPSFGRKLLLPEVRQNPKGIFYGSN